MQSWDVLSHDECGDAISPADRVAMIEAFRHRPRFHRRPSKREELLKTIERVVAPLRKKIAVLEESLKEPVAPKPDAFEIWITSKEAQKYAGEFVACTAPGEVVEHSENSDELMRRIAKYPNQSELIIDQVPRAES